MFKRYLNGYAFKYDGDTGKVYRRQRTTLYWRETGKKLDRWGYFNIIFEHKQYLVHRFVFLIATGDWPKDQVDHINGAKADNRWVNLRDVTAQQNQANQHRKPPTGEAHITRTSKGFRVRVRVMRHIGYYALLSDAIKARDEYLKRFR